MIRNNTQLSNLQDNVFIYQTVITGQAFADFNLDGVRNLREPVIAGRTIELLDASDTVIATAITDRNGVYRFNDVGLGTFTVREVLPAGFVNTKRPSQPTVITHGQIVFRVNFGEAHEVMPPINRIL